MASSARFTLLRARAKSVNLGLTHHNPGDRRRYRIHGHPTEDYFDGGVLTVFTLAEVEAFIEGYIFAKNTSIRRP